MSNNKTTDTPAYLLELVRDNHTKLRAVLNGLLAIESPCPLSPEWHEKLFSQIVGTRELDSRIAVVLQAPPKPGLHCLVIRYTYDDYEPGVQDTRERFVLIRFDTKALAGKAKTLIDAYIEELKVIDEYVGCNFSTLTTSGTIALRALGVNTKKLAQEDAEPNTNFAKALFRVMLFDINEDVYDEWERKYPDQSETVGSGA